MASSSCFGNDHVAEDKVIALPEDPGRFTKGFHAFMNAANYYDVMNTWNRKVFSREVVDQLISKRHLDSDNSVVRILGVGSGAGDIDLTMAQVIKSRFKKVHNTVVEPAQDQVALYRQLIEKTKYDDVRDIAFDFRDQTLEEYRLDDNNRGRKFDFINAVNSLYHVDDHDDTIGYLYDSLEDGGILLMVNNTETAGFTLVARAFPQTQSAGNKQVTTKDIQQSLEKRGIPYKVFFLDLAVDLTAHLESSTEEESPSEETDLIMDFITMTTDVRTQAPKFYEQFLSFLKSDPRCLKRGDDGKLLFNIDCELVIAQK